MKPECINAVQQAVGRTLTQPEIQASRTVSDPCSRLVGR